MGYYCLIHFYKRRFCQQDLNMRYVAAALLSSLAEQDVSTANIEKILSSVGVECDSKMAEIVVKQTEGKSIEELIALGAGKLATMGGGGGAAPAAGAPAGG